MAVQVNLLTASASDVLMKQGCCSCPDPNLTLAQHLPFQTRSVLAMAEEACQSVLRGLMPIYHSDYACHLWMMCHEAVVL